MRQSGGQRNLPDSRREGTAIFPVIFPVIYPAICERQTADPGAVIVPAAR